MLNKKPSYAEWYFNILMIKGSLPSGFLCIAYYNNFFFFFALEGTTYENLQQIFSAVLLASAVFFLVTIGSILISGCFSSLFELGGYLTTRGFLLLFCLVSLWVSSRCSFKAFLDLDLNVLNMLVFMHTAASERDCGFRLSLGAAAVCM